MKARAVIKEQERERVFQICPAEKPLLVKILFEEVSFKASYTLVKRSFQFCGSDINSDAFEKSETRMTASFLKQDLNT